MKTDPNQACANAEERWGWAMVHDLIAHPLMAPFCWADWTMTFHDYTSRRAWPRDLRAAPGEWMTVQTETWDLHVRETRVPGLYEALCPFMAHRYGVQAVDHEDAARTAEQWFISLYLDMKGDLSV